MPSLVEIGIMVLDNKILNFVDVFTLFHNNLPLEQGLVLLLNKIEYPPFKDALCQVCLKLAQWFWRRRFLNFVNLFKLFCYYVPLEKGVTLH